MNVSVVICTWNRAALLQRTLQRMLALEIPRGAGWELIVVNNNCSDDTDAVAHSFLDQLPIRLLHESIPGKSNAANLAIEHAEGDLLLWTDDDVLIDRMWLVEYARAFEAWPGAAYFSGTVEPWFEAAPPAWITQNLKLLQGMLVLYERPECEGPVTGKPPVGANMAIRRDVLQQFQFNPSLGPNGSSRVVGEETELIERLNRAGHWGVWVPTARIQHFVSRERASRRFAWQYFVGKGRTDVRLGKVDTDGPRLFGAPRWLHRRLASDWVSACGKRLFGDASWVRDYVNCARMWGQIAELRQSMHVQRNPLHTASPS